jgi:hypothetical protein
MKERERKKENYLFKYFSAFCITKISTAAKNLIRIQKLAFEHKAKLKKEKESK